MGVADAPVNSDGQVAVVVDVPVRSTKTCACLYTCPAASVLNVTAKSSIFLARKHVIAVLAFETVRANITHTVAILTITFLNCLGYCETTVASPAYSVSRSDIASGAGSPAVVRPCP